MASVPGVVGGRLTGLVQTESEVESLEGFSAHLVCTETSRSSSDSDSGSSTKVIWEDEQTIVKVVPLTETGGTAIPVSHVIPYEQPQTCDETGRDRIKWTLTVRSISPRVNYQSDFEVPVFRTNDSDRNFRPDTSVIAEYQARRILRFR